MNAGAAFGVVNIQLAGNHGFFDARFLESSQCFGMPRQTDSNGAARIDREHFSFAQHQYREFAINFATDMVVRCRNLGPDI